MARLDDLPPGTTSTVEVAGRYVMLLRRQGGPEAREGGRPDDGQEARGGGWPDDGQQARGDAQHVEGPDDEGLYAFEAFCTHAGGPLGDGMFTSDHCIVCPWHGATFDARSGQVLRGPARKSLRTYRTFVEDGMVFVAL